MFLCYRAHRQCKCELCEIQRWLLRQHGDKFHSQGKPREPRNIGKGTITTATYLHIFFLLYSCISHDHHLSTRTAASTHNDTSHYPLCFVGRLEQVHCCKWSHCPPTLWPWWYHLQYGQLLWKQRWVHKTHIKVYINQQLNYYFLVLLSNKNLPSLAHISSFI